MIISGAGAFGKLRRGRCSIQLLKTGAEFVEINQFNAIKFGMQLHFGAGKDFFLRSKYFGIEFSPESIVFYVRT